VDLYKPMGFLEQKSEPYIEQHSTSGALQWGHHNAAFVLEKDFDAAHTVTSHIRKAA